ncbi:hypothetical protein C5167_040862 [Papaver somniferum]|uniref:Uncharacterized protein n=1 Tax=Papaver somniferum TaxID=3469 RepID=A0A4Y7IKC5_PAPSO|nr:hypothetical protein C5167_040862 [Papaver somniferum]
MEPCESRSRTGCIITSLFVPYKKRDVLERSRIWPSCSLSWMGTRKAVHTRAQDVYHFNKDTILEKEASTRSYLQDCVHSRLGETVLLILADALFSSKAYILCHAITVGVVVVASTVALKSLTGGKMRSNKFQCLTLLVAISWRQWSCDNPKMVKAPRVAATIA